ncbi:MAG: glycine--tRNA ligase subunit beta [Dethiobacteria bacterium]|nr:glycine--tRNA ligase subunit beta [Bacillota bacterium]
MTATHDLLFEIGCEEIPSRFIPGAMEQLEKGAAALLKDSRLGYSQIETWATPRRLVIKVGNLEQEQSDLVEQVKGPPVNRAFDEDGNPTRALEGFMQSHNITRDHLKEEMIKDALYIVIDKETPGRTTEVILPELLPKLIQKLTFPRPMYWQSKEVRFARPIRWLLALYNNKPIQFSYAGINAGQLTYGHRFLAPGPFEIDNIDHYFRCLKDNYIVVDHNLRKDLIREQLHQKAEEIGGEALIDPDLLEEVTYLVEYPVAVDGSFDSAYLDLPQEVPITSMQNHQRYFPIVEKEGGKLLPFFVGISNNKFNHNIRRGYAKVLQARLADGRFFYNEDRKEPLESYVEKLKSVIFLESLGSVDKKRARLVELTARLAEKLELDAGQIEEAKRVAHLCKADLVTNMVKEFPELQGVMGCEYARLSGETEEVARGIYEHYLPRFTGDKLPEVIEGALVSLADRFDTLAGCFAVGIQPTGSQDPYALRRQAQGAVSIMHGLELSLSFDDCISDSLEVLETTLTIDSNKQEQLKLTLRDFLIQRLRFLLQEKGVEHDVIEAVLTVPFESVAEVCNRASALEDYLKGPLLDEVTTAYNRVANLAHSAPGTYVDKNLFEDISEKELYRTLQAVENSLKSLTEPAQRLEKLQVLKQPIDHFFDNVMVMVDDEKLRNNRLNMLAALKATFNRVADFSKLQSP